jgi:nucleotide-binding universal stress UspA family protein
MYKKILVPLDGSKRAEAILPHVKNLALCFKAKVIFFIVIEPLNSTHKCNALVGEKMS